MYSIGQISHLTKIPNETIRYYERIKLLPIPQRAENGYRQYDDTDMERLDFIRRARTLDFSLNEIKEILALRERQEPPCQYVMDVMEIRIDEIEARIKNLTRLRDEIEILHQTGKTLPEDVHMKTCVCHLITTSGA